MSSNPIRFDNGAAYERYMGQWSRMAGEAFIDWLAQGRGLRWLDVGCGNGAFTELFAERSAPASVTGIDPSENMLAFARTRTSLRGADLRQGDAMALPFTDGSFDVAIMPLVIFFVPDPAKGVAEMKRVVRPGGVVAAYSWDMDGGGGFPYAALQAAMQELGIPVPVPPSAHASKLDVKLVLWRAAGLLAVETHKITVQRTFANFEDYWTTILGGPSVGATLAALSAGDSARLQERLRARLPADASGQITYGAWANAIKGTVPG